MKRGLTILALVIATTVGATVKMSVQDGSVRLYGAYTNWNGRTVVHRPGGALGVGSGFVYLATNAYYINDTLVVPIGPGAPGEYPDYYVYAPTNAYPGAAFNPPVAESSYAGAMIAEWTRSANSNETVVYTTEETLTDFVSYGTETYAISRTSHAGYGHIQMPEDGFKMIWPVTATTTGQPILVESTIAWWLGPDLCTTEESFNIYGNNLLATDGSTSYAYIDGYGFVTNASGNDYKVTFNVPDDLANGTYTVYAHNGSGGKYGWSAGHQLRIYDGIDYTVATNTVTAGSFSSLKTTLENAAPGTTVVVPAGTYSFTQKIRTVGLSSNLWIKGAGMGSTIFVGGSGLGANYLLTDKDADGGDGSWGLKVTGVTFDYGDGVAANPNALINLTRGGNSRFEGCEFTHKNVSSNPNAADLAVLGGSEFAPLYINNCLINGADRFRLESYVCFNSNTNYGMYEVDRPIDLSWSKHCDLSGNFSTQYDASLPSKSSSGRWMVSQHCVTYNVYIGGNTSLDLKPGTNATDNNEGEQILIENNDTDFIEMVTSATSNTIVSGSISSTGYNGRTIVIISGRGFGQVRRIVAVDAGLNTATVEPAWLVEPDSSSVCALGRYAHSIAVVDNYFDGYADYRNTASAAVSMYGGVSQCIVANNTAHQIEDGFINAILVNEGSPALFQPTYFNLFLNNHVIDPARHGGSFGYGGESYSVKLRDDRQSTWDGIATFGVLFRNNTFSNALESLLTSSDPEQYSSEMTVWEFNTGTATNGYNAGGGVNTYTNGNEITIL